MREEVAQNKSFKKENVMVQLQQSLVSKLGVRSRVRVQCSACVWLQPILVHAVVHVVQALYSV